MHQVKLSNPKNQQAKKAEKDGPSDETFPDFHTIQRRKTESMMWITLI